MNDENLEDRITKLIDGTISPEELELLENRFRDDPSARALYFDYIGLECSLDTVFSPPIHRALEKTPRIGRRTKWAMGIAAAAAVVVLAVMHFIYPEIPPAKTQLQFCGNSQWTLNNKANSNPGELPEGTQLQILHGVAELKFPKGVVGIVEGPARMALVDEQTLQLDYGRAHFRVPDEGKGFTVITPYQRIVDLGTEFGVLLKKHQNKVELHVFEGEVRVNSKQNGNDQSHVVAKGQLVLLDGLNIKEEARAKSHLFQKSLPREARLIFEEDFEYGMPDGSPPHTRGIVGWKGNYPLGVFNPSGNGQWYKEKRLLDKSPSEGVIGAMKGPNLGFLPSGTYTSKRIGSIKPNHLYKVAVAIGVRDTHPAAKEGFAGYVISLKSGKTTLSQIASHTPPGAHNSVTTVNLHWNASQLPTGISPGDPLTLEIASGRPNKKRHAYLDFDNVRVTVFKTGQTSE